MERRVKHPLLPIRILASRTRGVAFMTMFIVPAAMFAMFYFLSQFIQNVMGYSPLQAGLAFLPFPFAMVFGAVISSKLVAKVDPRFISGTGTALAGLALFMFSRLHVNDSAANLSDLTHRWANGGMSGVYVDGVNYWTQIFPYIAVMAFGMALTFIPMMLTALHGVDERDAGVGSGVLNTAQQLGGALGLAILSTIAVNAITTKAQALVQQLPAGHGGVLTPVQQAASPIGQAAFTHGSTTAFLVGAFMMWGASALLWLVLNVKHQELQGDHTAPGAIA